MDPFERVLAEPGSLAARRALAAHWHAKGDPRADLIDKQLALRDLKLAGDFSSDKARSLTREVEGIIAQHGRAYAGLVADLVSGSEFHRGLVAKVMVSGEQFPSVAAELFRLAPIQHLNITAPLGDLERILAVPQVKKLATIDFARIGDAFGDAGARIFARSTSVSKLRYIEFYSDAIGRAGAEALAASPYLEHALYVGLRENPADATPFANNYDGVDTGGRPPLAEDLEDMFGKRPWLAIPEDPENWPPDRDECAVTP